MLQNTLANLAMAQAQEAQQRQNYARQVASGDFGRDHLGNRVNKQQRKSWNDRLSNFRNQRGAGTSQDLYRSIEGGQNQIGQPQQFNGGPDQFGSGIPQGRDNMAPGEWADPNGPGVGGYLGRGIQGLENGVSNGVAAFGKIGDIGRGFKRGYEGYQQDGIVGAAQGFRNGRRGYAGLAPDNTKRGDQGYVPGTYNGYDFKGFDELGPDSGIGNGAGAGIGAMGAGDIGDDEDGYAW